MTCDLQTSKWGCRELDSDTKSLQSSAGALEALPSEGRGSQRPPQHPEGLRAFVIKSLGPCCGSLPGILGSSRCPLLPHPRDSDVAPSPLCCHRGHAQLGHQVWLKQKDRGESNDS